MIVPVLERRSFLGGLAALVLGGRWLQPASPLPVVYGQAAVVAEADVLSDVRAMITAIEAGGGPAVTELIVPGDWVRIVAPDGQSTLYQIAEEIWTADGARRRLKLTANAMTHH